MRKIVIRSCMALFTLGVCELSAFAESATGTTEYKKTGKEALEGLFFGIGLDQSSSIEKIDCIKQTYLIDGGGSALPMAPVLLPSTNRSAVSLVSNRLGLRGVSSVSNIKATPANRATSFEAHDYTVKCITSGQNNKMGGSLLVGYGNFVCPNIYCGLELGVDIARNKERFVAVWPTKMKDVKLKQHGVIPSLSARFGFYSDALDAMLYAKAGVAVWNSKLETKLENIRLIKIMPTIGVGIEKKIELISLRGEFDYRLPLNKILKPNCYDETMVVTCAGLHISITDHSTLIRAHQQGYTVRIMGVMHL